MGEESFVRKTLISFDQFLLKNETSAILNNPKYQNIHNQICFTGVRPDDLPSSGAGSLMYSYYCKEQILKKNANKESDFIYFLEEFTETYFFKVFNNLSKYFKLGRMRLMTLEPKRCYTMHVDQCKRLHIAILGETSACGLIHNNSIFKIPADGQVYMVNTKKEHTAFNSSYDKPRTNLVIDVLEEYRALENENIF